MRLSNLELLNFRNYENLSLVFEKDLVIFLGENAQGKTNVLEAIYALAMTRSHRTTHEQELIEWQKKEANVRGTIEKKSHKVLLDVCFTKKGRRTKINHLEQKKLSSYVGQMNVILFAPEDLALVKGTPQLRRKFLDMEIGQISPVYLHNLVQYQHVLKQRNLYLKQLAETKKADELYLTILTEQLIEFGSKVLFERLQFIKKLEHWANTLHQSISQQKETLTITYDSSIELSTDSTIESIAESYQQALGKTQKNERFRQVTLVGPHRDELLFFINGHNVQTYGSQGQQRTTALSVKLAEIDLMKEETGEYPILLLDDVMSELDDSRQLHLLEAIEGKVQTFLTTTTLDHVKEKMTVEPMIYYVEQGKIKGESA